MLSHALLAAGTLPHTLSSSMCSNLEEAGKSLPMRERALIALATAEGLDYLHLSGIVHLDVKVRLPRQICTPSLCDRRGFAH